MTYALLRRHLRRALCNGRSAIVWAAVVWAVFSGSLVGPNIVICFEHDGTVTIEYASANCCSRCDPSDGEPAGALSVDAACDGPREFACEQCTCIRPGYVTLRAATRVQVASAFTLAPDFDFVKPVDFSHDGRSYAATVACEAPHAASHLLTPLRC